MAFMEPYYTDDPFFRGENASGETSVCPVEVWGTPERFAQETGCALDSVETIRGKYWARLSASGYMDCTEWDGPYASLDAARAALAEAYDVDPDYLGSAPTDLAARSRGAL